MFIDKHIQGFGLWLIVLMALFGLAFAAIALDKPMGGITGQVTLQKSEFGLHSYDVRGQKVYALAMGPRGTGEPPIERGVWVRPDGRFTLNRLPVGEYTLKVRAPGFNTYYDTTVFVEEGRIQPLAKNISLTILAPSVNVASNSRVFTTKEAPSFWINAMGAERATIKLYRFDPMRYLLRQARDDDPLTFGSSMMVYRGGKPPEKTFGRLPVLKTLTRKLTMDVEDWARAQVKLEGPLPPGDYLALVEAFNFQNKRDWNVLWFTVTDMGLIVKQSPEKTLVRAVNLTTMAPQPGVSVHLYDQSDPGHEIVAIQTGADGFAERAMPPGISQASNYALFAYGQHGPHRAYGGLSFYRDPSNQYQTYFYTERPVYRLGQTVYYKGLTRRFTSEGFQNPRAGLPIQLALSDPDGNTLWEGTVRTSAHGTFHGVLDIPGGGKTGAYELTMTYPDGGTQYERFEVVQYRKPEYEVTVTPLKPQVTAGETVSARIRATYYFGAPVAHARVKYTIYAATDWSTRYRLMPRPGYHGYFDDWEDAEGYEDTTYGGDYVSDGYAQTDENGEAIVTFQTQPRAVLLEGPFGTGYDDKRYKVQAEVTDLSRMTVVGSGSVSATAGAYALFVQPEHTVYKAGETIRTRVAALDYAGKPVAGRSIRLKAMRWVYHAKDGRYTPKVLATPGPVRTDAQGQATIAFTPQEAQLPTDTYTLLAESTDAEGHGVCDTVGVWIASPNNPYRLLPDVAEQEPLAIKLDKPVYQPGETARVMISAPVSGQEGREAIVSVEGNRLYQYQVVPLTATAQLLEIPIQPGYAPNVYVSVAFVGPRHQFFEQSQILKVSPQDHFLQLSVSTDRERYHPGETVTYTVQATDRHGRPAANVELSLGVVDESIYAIRPEQAPEITKFFYPRRNNWVVTASSFPEEYSGGPDKIEPRVRKDFRDMAGWFPTLVTNAQGIATTKITLPDNLTTWRATVRGIDADTNVGATIQKILSTQDLLVRLALPRFYTQGDAGALSAIVHNETRQPQAVRVALVLTPGLVVKEALQQTLHVPAGGASRFTWSARAEQSGEATAQVQAMGPTAGDALERKIMVNPLGVETTTVQTGVLTQPDQTVTLPATVPQGVLPQAVRYHLGLAASTLGPVLGNFNNLIDYPYGCTEQTMSRLMPSVVAMQLHQRLQVPLSPQDRARFQTVYVQAMTKLADYQNDDGGWGWWGYDASNPMLTGLVLEGLARLKDVGYAVDPDRVSRARIWLRKTQAKQLSQLADPKLVQSAAVYDATIDLAYGQYALGLFGEKPSASLKAWVRQRQDRLVPEALAYWTLAFHQAGDQVAANETYQALLRLGNVHPGLLDWDHTETLYKRLGIAEDWGYTYRFSGVESTALVMRAVLAMEPDNTERLEAIKSWLMLQRNPEGWENTKTTAAVLYTLMLEELANGHPDDTAFTLRTSLSEPAFQRLVFDRPMRYAAEKVFHSTLAALKASVVSLEKSGAGRLYYTQLITAVLPLRPGEVVPIKASPSGLRVSREYFRIVPKALTSEGRMRLSAVPLRGGTIRAGETLLVKVQIQTPAALPYVIVESSLPSGGEVLSDDPRESAMGSDETWMGDWESWWWTHQDNLDDRVVYFATHLPAGQSTFHALVRMEMPGTFHVNPVSLKGMYTRLVQAYSPVDTLTVVE